MAQIWIGADMLLIALRVEAADFPAHKLDKMQVHDEHYGNKHYTKDLWVDGDTCDFKSIPRRVGEHCNCQK